MAALLPQLYIRESASLAPLWAAAAQQALPGYEPVLGSKNVDPHRAELALVWKPTPGFLASLPNLKLVVSVGAGVDHIVMSDPQFPRHVPLVRMVDPGLTQGMCDYVAWACLSVLRQAQFYRQEQAAKRWETKPLVPATQRSVGVLGLGRIGLPVAQTLQHLGFQVRGWSRTPKTISGLESHAGDEGFFQILRQSDMIVNLLPATPQTQDMLGVSAFDAFKPGAALINAGRGATVDEHALLKALDTGQVGAAYLDVFKTEPLPDQHRLWSHPSVTLTPHNASITHPESGVRALSRAVAEMAAGKPLSNLVNWDQGY